MNGKAHGQITDILFDQAHIIQQVPEIAADRLQLQSGDFFRDTLPACDADLPIRIIHNWDDVASIKILKSVRRFAPKSSKVLRIEATLPDNPGPNWTRTLHTAMLAISGR